VAVPAGVDVPATVDVGLPQASGAAARDTALEAAAEAANDVAVETYYYGRSTRYSA